MASATQIKIYLAHWFQLGKKVICSNGREELLPQAIIRGETFAPEFEACWKKIMSVEGRDCYLEGSDKTIQELLSSAWDIHNCPRCNLPVPIVELGTQPLDCTCSDLENWPNSELPAPHSPVNNSQHLNRIKSRLEHI